MPTIRVTVPKSSWSREEKAELVTALTDGLASVAGRAGKGDIKQYVNVHIEEASEGGYAMGGNVVG